MVRIAMLAALAVVSWVGSAALAQTFNYNGREINVSEITPEMRAEIEAKIKSGELNPRDLMGGGGRGGRSRGGPRGPRPGGDGPEAEATPAENAPKPEGAEGDKPADTGPATIKREDNAGPADPNELKAKPDKDGLVEFSFHGQAWTDVLEWYAQIANCSLDWTELPADKLNLITQRKYTVDQTRDLLNRYLLARGFTMLRQGSVLSVMKIDKIEPSLVPRVEPDDLEDHQLYDFVRVRFDLPAAMDPTKAVEDVKVLLNATPKVTPLLASKQVMVIDAVANCLAVRDLLYSQQMAEASDVRPEQFEIHNRRADYIADQIMIVLGLDPSSRKTPMELQLEQQRMQLMMQMQQQGKDISGMIKQDGPQVFIAVDRRRNTVSVNAPPKEMEIIKRVVEQFDVPNFADDEPRDGMITKRYTTATVSSEAVVSALKEMADLSPLSQVQADQSSRTIFATGTAEDHKVIEGMLAKLDGSNRELRVIWLSRRTPADQVAGTIQALMTGDNQQDNSRNRYGGYYGYYDPYGYGGRSQQSQSASFRIQADVDNNRLIVMATDTEFAQVTSMLEELGVITNQRSGNPDTFRVLEARDPRETQELLQRLKEAWGGKNELNINVAPPTEAPPAQTAPRATAPTTEPASTDEDEDTLTTEVPRATAPRRFWLAQYVDGVPAAEAGAEGDAQDQLLGTELPESEPADAPTDSAAADAGAEASERALPPVNLTVTPDGRIVISSADPMALDQLEDLLAELAPPAQDFKVYKLNNTDCFDVYLNLRDYFEDELADDSTTSMLRRFSGMEEEAATLGKRRKLRFIYDPPTNTVLVQNASPAQLQTIDELVKIYDQSAPEDAIRQRRTTIVQIQYSRAQDIATAVKEVYRDLLSSKDKEFQNNRNNGDQRGGGRRQEIFYRLPGSENSKSAPVKVAFEGALSIGVDEISNTLIVSAEEQILNDVVTIVKNLDEEARPDTVVQVHRITGSLDAEELEDALETALSQPWRGGNPANGNNNRGGGRNGGGGGGGFRGGPWGGWGGGGWGGRGGGGGGGGGRGGGGGGGGGGRNRN
jgi:type II secretory pathway component GspD/PulD (secretin)